MVFRPFLKLVEVFLTYFRLVMQELPKKISKEASPKVLLTKPSSSQAKAPRRLKKKAKDAPSIVFSMEEEEELEDLEEGSLHRHPRKTPQATVQVYIVYIPFFNVTRYSL